MPCPKCDAPMERLEVRVYEQTVYMATKEGNSIHYENQENCGDDAPDSVCTVSCEECGRILLDKVSESAAEVYLKKNLVIEGDD